MLLFPSVPTSVPVKYMLQVDKDSRWILSKFGVFSTNSVPQRPFLSGKAVYFKKKKEFKFIYFALCEWVGKFEDVALVESALSFCHVGPMDEAQAVRLVPFSLKDDGIVR